MTCEDNDDNNNSLSNLKSIGKDGAGPKSDAPAMTTLPVAKLPVCSSFLNVPILLNHKGKERVLSPEHEVLYVTCIQSLTLKLFKKNLYPCYDVHHKMCLIMNS